MKKVMFTSENTLAQQCYEQLQRDIITGVLKPGEKLKVQALKDRFAIGQSPIREALSRLAAFSLVDLEENKGFRVAVISEADIRDTYATFTAIENRALFLSMQHGDDAWEALVVGALHRLSLIEQRNLFDCYAAWAERNYDFHVALISACQSPILLSIRHHLYMKFDRYCRMAYHLAQQDLVINNHEHNELAQAVLARDVKRVEALNEYHINGAIEEVVARFKQNDLM
ncbi:MAG: GntR family transcriptional regulator [bacterium]